MRYRIFKLVAVFIAGQFVMCSTNKNYKLDYDQMIILDAESLGEAGIGEAYQVLLPKLREFVKDPAKVEELEDPDPPSYSVRSQGVEYVVYAPELPEEGGQSWGRATYAFFRIVNQQLEHSSIRFYAINGGNDLGGMFLTESESAAARLSLPNKTDWPYLPTNEAPWFGQYH
ncbi:MAG: hypothetical protein IPM46_14510 [Flavobacteriales bacterium]|nr:hypothetical protein [Flavobacteriales bacterium]